MSYHGASQATTNMTILVVPCLTEILTCSTNISHNKLNYQLTRYYVTIIACHFKTATMM